MSQRRHRKAQRRHQSALKHARQKAESEQETLRDAAADPAVQEARVAVRHQEHTGDYYRAVPFGLRVAAGWSWRLAVVVLAVLGIGWVLAFFSGVTVAIAVALLLTALLQPFIKRLVKWGCPRVLAVALGVVGGFLAVVGALVLIVQQIVAAAGDLGNSAVAGFEQLLEWAQGLPLPFPVDEAQLAEWQDQLISYAQESVGDITGYVGNYATAAASATVTFFTGLAIALFTLFFFLYDGRKIWNAVLRFIPVNARERTDVAARSGWHALSSYVRATVIVAAVDAVGVLIVALFLGLQLAPALAALVFLGAFIPIVGALVTGFVAVAVALVTLGPIEALIMLVGILLVMQLESNVLQPFLLGKAVSIHPLAVILAIAFGISLAGVVGGLIVIPVLAFSQRFVSTLARGDSFGEVRLPDPPPPPDPPSSPEAASA